MKSDLSNTEIAPVTTLPESVRIPLHSLQADLEYLIGRVIANGSCGPMITKSMRDRLGQIEAAFIPANKAVAFCDWLYGYMGHGTAVTIGDYEATYIRSKLASLIKDIDGHRGGVPCANANGTDVYHETVRRVSAVREKRLAESPVWYGAEQADAWADGYNSALEEIAWPVAGRHGMIRDHKLAQVKGWIDDPSDARAVECAKGVTDAIVLLERHGIIDWVTEPLTVREKLAAAREKRLAELAEENAQLRAELAKKRPEIFFGTIAEVYGGLDAEDCAMIDREWARMRGYILPTNGPSTLSRPAPQTSPCLNCGDPSHEPFCGTCREMGCAREKPSLPVKSDRAAELADRLASMPAAEAIRGPKDWATIMRSLRAAPAASEPVAYRVKDFAGGWILCHTREVAEREADGQCLIEPIYNAQPKTSDALKSAAEKTLNYIENTENELGIKLSCGDALREVLK